jgi:hypothetical protein
VEREYGAEAERLLALGSELEAAQRDGVEWEKLSPPRIDDGAGYGA